MPDKDNENLEDKKSKKRKKKAEPVEIEEGYEQEKLGSKMLLFLVTILIIAIWLGIIALLIKMDVGGFGSSVLYPILKDVPYVKAILPENEDDIPLEEIDTQYMFESMDEAVERIKELELLLYDAQELAKDEEQTIQELREENADLAQYKEEQAAFELEKEKFYEEVVLGEHSPDINEYKAYYESIDPENAEVLYKQVVEQSAYNDEMKDYVRTYSSMKAKNAAAIFDTMTNDLGLVADILYNMDTQSRADILAAMDKETAAKITEILEPEQ